MRPVLTVSAVLLMVGVAWSPPEATVHALARPSVVHDTVSRHVSPVDAGGHLRSGYVVRHHLSKASCQFGSEASGTAYRCFAGNYVIDPCWVAANKHYVDCLTAGWSHAVWRLHVTKGYDNEGYNRRHGGRGNDPWGVQTVSGARCGWLQGATGTVGKYRINYGCGKSPKTVLIGNVNRRPATWTIRKAHDTGNYKYKRDGRVELQRAWYGKPSREG